MAWTCYCEEYIWSSHYVMLLNYRSMVVSTKDNEICYLIVLSFRLRGIIKFSLPLLFMQISCNCLLGPIISSKQRATSAPLVIWSTAISQRNLQGILGLVCWWIPEDVSIHGSEYDKRFMVHVVKFNYISWDVK